MSGPIDKPIGQASRPLSNNPVVPDRHTAQRFSEATKYVEAVRRGGSPRTFAASIPVNPGYFARTTSTVSAASGLTLGTGSAQLCSLSGLTLTVDGDTVSVLNLIAVSIPSSTLVILSWINGAWTIVVAPCPT